jgi:hypothetical protein
MIRIVARMIAADDGPYRPRPYSCASQRYRRKWDREFESGLLQLSHYLLGQAAWRYR